MYYGENHLEDYNSERYAEERYEALHCDDGEYFGEWVDQDDHVLSYQEEQNRVRWENARLQADEHVKAWSSDQSDRHHAQRAAMGVLRKFEPGLSPKSLRSCSLGHPGWEPSGPMDVPPPPTSVQ